MSITKKARVIVRIEKKSIPIREEMSNDAFHAMMTTGYSQALKDDSQPMDEVFKELEDGLSWLCVKKVHSSGEKIAKLV